MKKIIKKKKSLAVLISVGMLAGMTSGLTGCGSSDDESIIVEAFETLQEESSRWDDIEVINCSKLYTEDGVKWICAIALLIDGEEEVYWMFDEGDDNESDIEMDLEDDFEYYAAILEEENELYSSNTIDVDRINNALAE